MKKKTFEIIVGLILITVLSGLIGIYALGYDDSDGDGIPDSHDAFPNDPLRSKDSDGDGIDDITDAFPYDPNEQYDRDGDGIGNNVDEFPNDPKESKDSDNDGIGDNEDVFPFDPEEQYDFDGDGVGDNKDECPNDPSGSIDSDGDGVCNESDAFPFDPKEQYDLDDDGVGDNADAFPDDPNEQNDSDDDGVGDNADAFPNDPEKWRNSSAFPTEIVFDRYLELSDITNGIDITYDGTYYYILNHDNEDENKSGVYQFNKNFSFTGLIWDYFDYAKEPVSICYYYNKIYIITNEKTDKGYKTFIYTFSTKGKYKTSVNLSSSVGFSKSITKSDNRIYIYDIKSPKLIHIFDASTLNYIKNISDCPYSSDFVVHKTGNWFFINDQSPDEKCLYLYDLDGNYLDWNKQFYHRNIELVGDRLIALTGNRINIYKLF